MRKNKGDFDTIKVSHTLGVILSKPAWMWGAEMGANQVQINMIIITIIVITNIIIIGHSRPSAVMA